MEGAWIERPGQSSGSKSLEERAKFIVCPDSLTGEVSGTLRLSSQSRRPKDEEHPHCLVYPILNSSSHTFQMPKKNTHQEPKTVTSIGVFKIHHKTATPPSSTWVALHPSCHYHRGKHRYPSSYPPTPGAKCHPHNWFSCNCRILPPINLDSNLFPGLDLGLD